MASKFFNSFKNLLSILFGTLVGLLFALALREYVFFNAFVPSESMYPTIATGDLLIGSRLTYRQDSPQRGDVVTFNSPDVAGKTYLKRIIGLPGETLTIVDGRVYIDGSSEPLNEPYINPEITPTGDFGPCEIPEGCYFVMGDNRNDSLDSRYWESPFISIDEITSKIIFRYYPSFEMID